MSRVRFGEHSLMAHSVPRVGVGERCLLCIRPHDLVLDEDSARGNVVAGNVASVLWQGEAHAITITTGGSELRLASPPFLEPPQLGSTLKVRFDARDAVLVTDGAENG